MAFSGSTVEEIAKERRAYDMKTEEVTFKALQANVVDVVLSLIDRLDKPFKGGLLSGFGRGDPRAATDAEAPLLAACKDRKEMANFVTLLDMLVYINLTLNEDNTARFMQSLKTKLSDLLTLTRRYAPIRAYDAGTKGVYEMKQDFANLLSETYNLFFLTPETPKTPETPEDDPCKKLARIDNLKKNARSGEPKINPQEIWNLVYAAGTYTKLVKSLKPARPAPAPGQEYERLQERLRVLKDIPAERPTFEQLRARYNEIFGSGSTGGGGAGGYSGRGGYRKTLKGSRKSRKNRKTRKARKTNRKTKSRRHH